MASKGASENRLKSYKTKGLDMEEGRRRREEEGIQLRRSKREEQVCYEFISTDPGTRAQYIACHVVYSQLCIYELHLTVFQEKKSD